MHLQGTTLVVRRTRLVGPQEKLWPDWRHFAFLTDLSDEPVTLDRFHREHACVELCIDELKERAGMEHCPSGNFCANAAWLCCAVLAHNLMRWTELSATLSSETRTRHSPHTSYPLLRRPRTPRQPLRTTDASHAEGLAAGRPLQHRPHEPARSLFRHLENRARTGVAADGRCPTR